MSWVTSILSLQNEYFISEDLLEINKKSEELLRKYFEVSLLAKGLNKSTFDKVGCLNNELTRFNNYLKSEILKNRNKYKYLFQ